MDDEGKLMFKPLVELPCTFCRSRLQLGRSVPVGGTTEETCMLHSDPPCKTFLELDLLEFMQQNRRRLGIPDSVVDSIDN